MLPVAPSEVKKAPSALALKMNCISGGRCPLKEETKSCAIDPPASHISIVRQEIELEIYFLRHPSELRGAGRDDRCRIRADLLRRPELDDDRYDAPCDDEDCGNEGRYDKRDFRCEMTSLGFHGNDSIFCDQA